MSDEIDNLMKENVNDGQLEEEYEELLNMYTGGDYESPEKDIK